MVKIFLDLVLINNWIYHVIGNIIKYNNTLFPDMFLITWESAILRFLCTG